MSTTVWPWYKKRYTCSAFPSFEQGQDGVFAMDRPDNEFELAGIHLALAREALISRPVQTIGSIIAIPFLGGLP